MAEFLNENNTNLGLVFPSKKPSTYKQIQNVAQRANIYPGEDVLVVLSLQYTGSEQSTESKHKWRNCVEKLRVTSCNSNCFRKAGQANDCGLIDKTNTSLPYTMKINSREQVDKQFKLCQPFASYSNGKYTNKDNKNLSNPIAIQDDEVVIPTVVTVNTTDPDSVDTALVSVNVSGPPSSAQVSKEGFLDLFLKIPIQEVFDLHSDRWKGSVQAELPVLPPPEVKCRHIAAGGKHFLIVTVSNQYEEDLKLTDLQVLVNKNEGLVLPGRRTNLSNVSKGVDSSNIELILSKSSHLPVTLQPLEQHNFVFRLHISQEMWRNNSSLATGIHIPLFLSASWHASSMDDGLSICTHYALPTIRLDFPSFVMSAQCSSPVAVGESFHVTYTLLNNLQDFLGITLLWMPGNAPVTYSDENSLRFIEEAVVCQQPTNQLGFCAKGSTATVTVPFQAIRPGLHELGKYMKLKLQYTQPPNSSKPNQKQEKPPLVSEKKDAKIAKPKLPRHLSVERLSSSGAPPPAMSPSLPRRSHSLTGSDDFGALNSNRKGVHRVESTGSGDKKGNAWKVNSERRTLSPVKPRQDNLNIVSPTVSVDRIAKKKCQILVLNN